MNLKTNMLNAQTLNFNLQRRESLKNLALLSFAGVSLINLYKNNILQEVVLDDLVFTQAKPDAQILMQSNVSQELLSLPLKHFSIPHHFETLLTRERQRYKDEKLIIYLTNHQYLDYTNYYIDVPFKHVNLEFFTHHYDSLGSLVRDLEMKNFYVRNLNFDDLNLQKELAFLTHHNYTEKELAFLRLGFDYEIFTMRMFENGDKVRIARALNALGEHNLKSLYMMELKHFKGLQKENKEEFKLIGKLATSIVI